MGLLQLEELRLWHRGSLGQLAAILSELPALTLLELRGRMNTTEAMHAALRCAHLRHLELGHLPRVPGSDLPPGALQHLTSLQFDCIAGIRLPPSWYSLPALRRLVFVG